MALFRFFESLLEPTALPANTTPPPELLQFYWHYARQARGLVIALFCAGFFVAVLDSTIPVFIGRVVTLVSSSDPARLWQDQWHQLVAMALVLLVGRPLALLAQNLITQQGIVPGLTNLIRWQSHWHVVRQGWTLLPERFRRPHRQPGDADRPGAARERGAVTNAVWYILVYGTSAHAAAGSDDLRLAAARWRSGSRSYVLLLRFFVPRMRDRSREMSEVQIGADGPDRRQLHQHPDREAVRAARATRTRSCASALDEHTGSFRKQLRLITLFGFALATLNAA